MTTPQNDDTPECRASQYVGLADTYEGRALCGCENCREYTAEHDYDEV